MLVTLVLLGLAVGRFTRLIVNDSLLDSPRDWVLPRLPSFLRELVSCAWCLSGWASLGAVAWVWTVHSLPMPPAAWLTVWWIGCCSYWLTEYLAAKTIDSGEPIEIETDIKGFWERHEGENR